MALGTVTFYPNYFWAPGVGYIAANEPSITGETYTCSGAETSGPAYDLVDGRRTSIVTIDTYNGGPGETTEPIIDMDLGGLIDNFDFCIVDNHNIETADAQIKLQYGSSPADRSLSAAYSGVYGNELNTESVSSNYVQNPTDGILLMLFTATGSSYWNLKFLYDPASYDADITMAEWGMGKAFSPSYSPEIGSIYSTQYKGINLNYSDGGQRFGFKRFGRQRAWKITWEYLSSSDKTSFENLFYYTDGERYPFWIDLGEATNPQLYFVRFVGNKLDFKHVTGGVYSLTVIVEEEI